VRLSRVRLGVCRTRLLRLQTQALELIHALLFLVLVPFALGARAVCSALRQRLPCRRARAGPLSSRSIRCA